jgi:hypothetical protein
MMKYKSSQKKEFGLRSRKAMKRNHRNIAIFRGLHFEPDKKNGPRNFFEMACNIAWIGAIGQTICAPFPIGSKWGKRGIREYWIPDRRLE